MNPILWTIILAVSPFFELRLAIPFGIAAGLNPALVFILAVTINVLIIPVIFVVLHFFFDIIFDIPIIGKKIHKIMHKAHKRALPYLDKYGLIGLAIFVAIPLPITGAYTGSLLAYFLEMKKHKAMFAIAVGVVIAGILVTLASLGILNFINYFLLP